MNEDEDYDVVLATLQEAREIRWDMNKKDLNSEFPCGMMFSIRCEQIDALDKAIKRHLEWKKNKYN
jgi:hypothetical protein